MAEMLHHIRAASRRIRLEARQTDPGSADAQARHLSRLLAYAIRRASPFDIAVALGSAAEFQCFPDDRAFDLCTRTIQRAGGKAVRAVVWAVRHRCARSASNCRRFVVPVR